MVSNTCIIFIIFFSKQNNPVCFSFLFFCPRRFVFILNKPPFFFGLMLLPVPAPVVAFPLAGRNGGGVMCHLAIYGPSLSAGSPRRSYWFSFVLFCFFFFFLIAHRHTQTRQTQQSTNRQTLLTATCIFGPSPPPTSLHPLPFSVADSGQI